MTNQRIKLQRLKTIAKTLMIITLGITWVCITSTWVYNKIDNDKHVGIYTNSGKVVTIEYFVDGTPYKAHKTQYVNIIDKDDIVYTWDKDNTCVYLVDKSNGYDTNRIISIE